MGKWHTWIWKNILLYSWLANELSYYHEGKNLFNTGVSCESVEGMDLVDGSYYLDSNLGRVTSRSTVGTYVGLSPYIRKIYANTKEAKIAGLTDGHFSQTRRLVSAVNAKEPVKL